MTWYPVLSITNFIILVGVFVINALSSQEDGTLFKNTVGNLSDKYYTGITPAGWTFSIWGFIYTWQALWVVYSLALICLKGRSGPAYTDPVFLQPALFIFYILTSGLNVTWLLTFDREYIEVACATLIATSFSLYVCLFVAYRGLDHASPELSEQGRRMTIWLVRAFVHNGLGIYATWVSIAALLNVQMVMIYRSDPGVSVETSGTVALSILSAEIAVFAGTDIFLLDRYSRYTFTPYLVIIVALAGSISKNWDSGATNSTFTAVLLAVGGVLLLIKLVVSVYRHMTTPRYRTRYSDTIGTNKVHGGQLA